MNKKSVSFTWAELDASLSMVGGVSGLPGLLSMVGAMAGGASMPESVIAWLGEAITKREPFSLRFATGGNEWSLDVK